MNTRLSQQVTALTLAALVTFASLGGVTRLAASERAAAPAQLAQAAAAAAAAQKA